MRAGSFRSRWRVLNSKSGSLRHNEGMVKSVEGIYRNGRVEIMEPISEAAGSPVIVTWVRPATPADLRRRLIPFAEDWDRPEMDAYDELPPR